MASAGVWLHTLEHQPYYPHPEAKEEQVQHGQIFACTTQSLPTGREGVTLQHRWVPFSKVNSRNERGCELLTADTAAWQWGVAQQKGSGQAPMVLAQSTKTSWISHCLTEGRALSLVLILPFYFQQGCFLFYLTLNSKSKLSSRAREIQGYPQLLHDIIRSYKSPPSIGLSQGPPWLRRLWLLAFRQGPAFWR